MQPQRQDTPVAQYCGNCATFLPTSKVQKKATKVKAANAVKKAADKVQKVAKDVARTEAKVDKQVKKSKELTYDPKARQRMLEAGKKTGGVGATIGNMLLPGIGGLVGNAAESLFKTILGHGDYTEVENQPTTQLTNNTIMGLQQPAVVEQVAQLHWNGVATRIAHKEYIGSVSMSSGFAQAEYSLDPTSTFMFPWLNGVASRFQKWKLLGGVIEYVPTSEPYVGGSSPAVGQVAIVPQYDVGLAPPSSLTNLLNTQGSVSCRPTDEMICPIECDPGLTPMNPLYVVHPATTVSDPRFYQFCNIVVATQGPAAYSNAGQLWISYDILLISAYVEGNVPRALVPKVIVSRDDEKSAASEHSSPVLVPRASNPSTGVLGLLGR